MTNIAANLQVLLDEINTETQDPVMLVAVSKKQSALAIRHAYDCGQKDFGENYVQELLDKQEELKDLNINWHFIGHLQRNKAKYIVGKVHLIQGVDNPKLLQEIEKQASKQHVQQKILLQVNVSGEESKSGCQDKDLFELITKANACEHITLCGLMTIGSTAANEQTKQSEFTRLKNLFEEAKTQVKDPNCWTELSMGMSGDFKLAIKQGSTMVRVGTRIFGERDK
ncbi:MAG: YggS family pyridoxal phosphate-dependent enzyme [Deltaproteobacteria bacterium]|nr:YggS family pyridoxal phosphate-dependent enzyme [Deltaproteobacteria bacterium]